MKRLAIVLLAVVVVVLDPRGALSAPRLGVASFAADSTACVTFRGDPVRMGERVLILLSSPPRVVDGLVQQGHPGSCNPNLELEGQGYRVALRYRVAEASELGFAILDPTARVEYADGEFVVHTKGAVTPLRFRQCASHEGIHLTAWRGNRRTWHEYWYVAFDLEPNCSDEEAGERSPR